MHAREPDLRVTRIDLAVGAGDGEARLDALGRGGPDPLQDKCVREAVNFAIDKEAIAKNLLGSRTVTWTPSSDLIARLGLARPKN